MMRCVDYKGVRQLVPYSRQHLKRLETEEKYGPDFFPKRVVLSQCRVCWMVDEVVAWVKRRADRR